jgi:DNA-directed RNA polymerase subunit beta
MNKIFVNNIGDLAEAQKASFYRLLSKGISEELRNFPNPFKSSIKRSTRKKVPCLVYFNPDNIKLKGPHFNIETCLAQDLTYAVQLILPCEYEYLQAGKPPSDLSKFNSTKTSKTSRIKKDVFFGELPLMTEEGTFIISGCERIVISQIIRSPGIYFRKEFNLSNKPIYTATIISNRGIWTKIFLANIVDNILSSNSAKKEVIKHVKENQIYIQLNEITTGANLNGITKIFLNDILKFFGLTYKEILDNLKYPSYLIKNTSEYTEIKNDLAKQNEFEKSLFIKKLFFNKRAGYFSIGEIGRYKINKKLGLDLPKDIHYLTGVDFIGIINGLIELKYYNRVSDDIDDLKNKQIRCVGDLLQNQIRIGLYRIQKGLLEEAPISNIQKDALTSDMDLRDLDCLIDPRPLTSSLKEFFKTSQLSQLMDQINPLAELTHKRRISVFGPNGLKRDHISTVIRDIHPSQYGRLCPIETPEGHNAGLISSLTLMSRVNALGTLETPYFFLKDLTIFSNKRAVFLNPEQESQTKIGFADIKNYSTQIIRKEYISIKDNYVFSLQKAKTINFITTSPLQIISLATALIPFIEHDDANRALMGSNMQRQAVPLLYTQKPIVGTGLEGSAILDSGMVIKTYCQGVVKYVSSTRIIIEDKSKQEIIYHLKKYYRSNQETSLNQTPLVWPGEKVFAGQLIADGPSINDGELALGKNLTIAYMPWEGYNFEDAVVINEKIILDDSLTSIHITEQETKVITAVTGKEKLTNNLANLTQFVRRHLNTDGIVKVGSYVAEHDILVGKLTPCEEDPSPEAKLLSALYGQKNQNYRDTSLKVATKTGGRVIDVRIINGSKRNNEDPTNLTSYEIIRIYIANIRKIGLGDKVAGRHGNKGIISRILPSSDMPYLPDGTPIDILFNPLGVPSRMNVGQIFECLLGLAGERLGKRFKIAPFDEIYGKEASRVLINQKLKEAAIVNNCNWLFNNYYPGKILLRDGRTGEYFDNPILVGKTYILKLIHLVENKIHARATGPYSMITEQPLAGKSQKGGQRFGEMEVWALEAYGCSNTLQELLTIKSDDIDGRNDMFESILKRKNLTKPTPSIPESFLALICELQALGLDFSMKKINSGFTSTSTLKHAQFDLFNTLEQRLKLRALLTRKQASFLNSESNIINKEDLLFYEKIHEQQTISNLFKT